MTNPYHDENGKSTSKENMMGAVLRLQAEGRSEEATQLFLQYKTASEKPATGTVSEKSVSDLLPSVKNTTDDRGAVIGAYSVAPSMTPQEKAEELSAFITGFGLKEGTHRNTREAEDAFSTTWERHGNSFSLETFDPNDTEKAQLLHSFTGRYGNQEILYAYRGGLYIDTLPLDDSWGDSTKYGYATRPAAVEPVVPEAEQKHGYFADSSEGAYEKTRKWEHGHTTLVSPQHGWGSSTLLVKGATLIHEGDDQEVSHGRYESTQVYRDDKTGDLYQVTRSWDSWDNGNDETNYRWALVEERYYVNAPGPKFVEGAGRGSDDEDSWGR